MKAFIREWGKLAAVVFVVVVGGLYVRDIAVTLQKDTIAGCERGNIQRAILYANTIRDAETRATAADDLGASGVWVALNAVEGFTEAQQMVNTYAGVVTTPGSVHQDCEKAYG